MATELRLESLELSLALGALVLFLALNRVARPSQGDLVSRGQALRLEVHEVTSTRTVRAVAPIFIGRMSSATIEVEDPHVSRQHARIDFMDGVFVIRDLDSRNGTFVNGQPIASQVSLSPGDRIDVGSARIVVGGLVAWK